MEEKNKIFHYTYSARQQEEIKAIRKKYSAPEEAEDKMAQLRRLDESTTRKASAISLAIGVTGALALGVGMSFTMTDIGKTLGPYQNTTMVIGIIIGLIGIVLAGLAYPTYNRVLKKERRKIAPEILRLTDELLK